ncbi:hypothetical protein GCM10020221_31250 [Streptomyces thioluteus]|uniref:Uncharacterized protein n=1 Tax=Streptomyces thioluteus TaxID=66431 RepID=A0ABN3X2S2_STRTU
MLRLIRDRRLVHFVVLGVLAVAVFLFAHERRRLRGPFYRGRPTDLQNGVGGTSGVRGHGLVGDLDRAFAANDTHALWAIGLVIAAVRRAGGRGGDRAVAARRRWAEYLTFVATSVLLVPEVYELTGHVSALKGLHSADQPGRGRLYLLSPNGSSALRGGGRAEEAVRVSATAVGRRWSGSNPGG